MQSAAGFWSAKNELAAATGNGLSLLLAGFKTVRFPVAERPSVASTAETCLPRFCNLVPASGVLKTSLQPLLARVPGRYWLAQKPVLPAAFCNLVPDL